jgi:glycosyltransferase involved in cell wall biosynthesis
MPRDLDSPDKPEIAVLIPCYNEETTIAAVVRRFRDALPDASIYVYDNNSHDETMQRAHEAGAIVRAETIQGKGHVVRRMFSDIDADIYVLVDGDGTYDEAQSRQMIDQLSNRNLAMVVGRRIHVSTDAYRPGHVAGNAMFTRCVAWLFGTSFSDILSGYRVFSRAFVKSFPVFSSGFEIETELTVHALTLTLPVGEVDTHYGERPAGSVSKLHTYKDGIRILYTILSLAKNERPLMYFSVLGTLLMLTALILVYPIAVTFIETGLVPRFPTAILSTGLAISSFVMYTCGLILDTVTKGRREMKMLAYLSNQQHVRHAPVHVRMASSI